MEEQGQAGTGSRQTLGRGGWERREEEELGRKNNSSLLPACHMSVPFSPCTLPGMHLKRGLFLPEGGQVVRGGRTGEGGGRGRKSPAPALLHLTAGGVWWPALSLSNVSVSGKDSDVFSHTHHLWAWHALQKWKPVTTSMFAPNSLPGAGQLLKSYVRRNRRHQTET